MVAAVRDHISSSKVMNTHTAEVGPQESEVLNKLHCHCPFPSLAVSLGTAVCLDQ